jgi:selenocysteine lyase/cysteine desulfurase
MSAGPSIAPGMSIGEAQELWSPAGTYLNTASYGLPSKPGWDALQAALVDWQGGRTSWEGWGQATEGSRRAFAGIVDVDPSHVAVGATVSGFVGLIAASLPDGARVLAPEIEFTSNLFPYLAQAHRGITVRTVPVADLAANIDGTVDLVAFSAVQMATGEVADFGAITAAAADARALTLCDATQAAGWLPLAAGDFDFVVCSAYKWLMCPRGVAFLTVRPSRLGSIVPAAAGWYAGEDIHSSYFGPPLRLATDARRLDTSPAWFSWVGAEPTLELLKTIGIEAVHAHDLALANAFREGLGLAPGNSAIVSVDRPGADRALARAGIQAAVRAGRLRVSWHVYNTDRDVEIALDALR